VLVMERVMTLISLMTRAILILTILILIKVAKSLNLNVNREN